MLTINTNLSSLITQSSMKQSTSKLNQAIERMTTGFKINHASDNAANYAIANQMTTKLNSLQVAEENTAMGIDLINTAEATLTQMQDRIERLRALQEQANNGSYGEDSLIAINKECNMLVNEINRLYESAEYNGITLFMAPTTLADGSVVIARESDAQLDTTFKEIGVTATHFEIYDSNNNFVQAYDLEENDTINDFLSTLQNQGFSTRLSNGEITISSADGAYITGELVNELGISTTQQSYVASTEQSYSKNIETTSAQVSSSTVYSTTTTETTQTQTINVTTTTESTQTNTIYTETTTESINIDWTTNGGNYYITQSTIYVNGTTITSETTLSELGITGEVYSYDTSGNKLGTYNQSSTMSDISLWGLGGEYGLINGVLYIRVAIGPDSSFIAPFFDLFDEARSNTQNIYHYLPPLVARTKETSTITITTTSSTTETQTIYTTTTSSTTQTVTLYVTTTSSTTQTSTVWITSTVSATGETTFEELGVSSAFIVTIVSDGTRSALTINKTSTFDEFFAQLESKGFVVSENAGNIELNASGDTYIHSTFLNNLLKMSSINKTESLKTVNTKSNYQSYDEILENVYAPGTINLLVGTSAEPECSISVDVSFKLSDLTKFRNIGVDGNDYLEQIDSLLAQISDRQVQFGAVLNRLDSVMDEIGIKYDNLVSSRSTIRDADIADVSSSYIQQQILQQAAATLLATANQSPSIALQLI